MTKNMVGVLNALAALRAERRDPSTPNEIAMKMGFRDGGRRHGNGANRSTTGWQAPANRIIFTLVALEKRGLIQWETRRDDLSGSAYSLTTLGSAEQKGLAK